jgi:molecular chaperone HscB
MHRLDPFAILGLPRNSRVDASAVQHAYLRATALSHPDATNVPDRYSIADLNRAKQVLDDPEQRAGVLLEILMHDAGLTLSSAEQRALPPTLLADMLSVRERLHDARAGADAAALAEVETWAENRRREHEQRVEALLEPAARGVPITIALARDVRRELNAWRYIERLLEQLDEPA